MNQEEKQKDPLSGAERKAMRKAMAKEKMGGNTQRRLSIFEQKFVVGDGSAWTMYEGLGWVHASEKHAFEGQCIKCKISGKYNWKFNMNILWDGTAISRSIMPGDKYFLCAYTNLWFPVEEGIEISDCTGDGKMWVTKTARQEFCFKCDWSAEVFQIEYRIAIYKSEKYKCVASKYCNEDGPFNACQNCVNWFEKAMVKTYGEIGMKACIKCYSSLVNKGIIHKHDHADYPKAIFHKRERYGHKIVDGVVWSTKKKEPYNGIRLFGVEVETEMNMKGCKKDEMNRHDMAKNILGAMGSDFIIVKEDGTLQMNGKYSGGELDPNGTGIHYAGFEIVSGPADLEVHRDKWPLLEKAEGFQHLRSWDTETCGFHVHVTRESLTYLQIARILMFINNKDNQLFIQKIAGRGSAKFCKYVEKEPGDALKVDPNTDDNRRQAVNLCNAKTIEFRIFRGTVNPKHIIRNIEFCDAVCDYSYPSSRSLRELKDWRTFVEFVDSNRKKWPLLAGWFIKHQFIQHADIKEVIVRKIKSIKMIDGKIRTVVNKEEIKLDKSKFTIKPEDIVEHEIKVEGGDQTKPMKMKAVAQALDDMANF